MTAIKLQMDAGCRSKIAARERLYQLSQSGGLQLCWNPAPQIPNQHGHGQCLLKFLGNPIFKARLKELGRLSCMMLSHPSLFSSTIFSSNWDSQKSLLYQQPHKKCQPFSQGVFPPSPSLQLLGCN